MEIFLLKYGDFSLKIHFGDFSIAILKNFNEDLFIGDFSLKNSFGDFSFDGLCRGRFCDKGRKCENGPNLPLGSLEVFIMENQAQNSKCIMNKRLMVL